MHFPFHLFSQHRFEVRIEYAILQLNFPARIILLFITHLLFITIFWNVTNIGVGQSFHRKLVPQRIAEMNSRNRIVVCFHRG